MGVKKQERMLCGIYGVQKKTVVTVSLSIMPLLLEVKWSSILPVFFFQVISIILGEVKQLTVGYIKLDWIKLDP